MSASPETPPIESLRAIAQSNADLSDAMHASAAPLCIYLLNMRDFYRWDRQLPFERALARSELGAWISVRETGWDVTRRAVEEGHQEVVYRPLFPELSSDPFDTVAIRDRLAGQGLAYGAGIGRFGRPQFFLARVIQREQREGCEVVVCGDELARGATAPPAMSRGREILVRQDALERWLWSHYEEWQHHPRENGFAAAYALHAGKSNRPEDAPAVIRRMAAVERETLILHELGERRSEALFGDDWHDLLDDLPNRKAEMLARAIRDLVADCTVTLPTQLQSGAVASVHCWFGLLDGTRLALSPGLADDYLHWRAGDDHRLLSRLEAAGEHFAAAGSKLLAAWRRDGAAGVGSLIDDVQLIFH